METRPWDVHPELREDRLRILGGLIKEVRRNALLSHEPAKGDTNWGLGCRIHERTMYAIIVATNEYPWLRVIESWLHFVFAIGKVPIRFYHGTAENPSRRYLRRKYPEIEANQMAFPFAMNGAEWFWRLAIETDDTGEVFRIVLVQVNESGDTRNPWEVPLSEPIPAVSLVGPSPREGVVLPPPTVTPLIEKPVDAEVKDDREG